MKFQPGDKVTYIDEGLSGGPETGKVYTVSRRSDTDTGVCLKGFTGRGDWWLDHRFELYQEAVYVVLTNESTTSQKFTKQELTDWLEKEHRLVYNPTYEVFKCVPVKIKVRSTVEIEE